MTAPQLTNWRLEIDKSSIAWLYVDRDSESTNTLGRAVMAELDAALDYCQAESVAGLVILSGKTSGFIAGADIREFGDGDESETADVIRAGHSVFKKLERMPCPTVAAIDGFCLGGGLELAMSCGYRIAKDSPGTKIGVPEIKLGIYPGLGGSVRLTERLGAMKAMELMLTGRALNARAARAAGLVDAVITPHEELYWHARRAVLQKRKS
ncbi:MAG: enoyl-CoA hydratase-related protein, partial [Pseudomonadota bacterium]